MVDQTNLKLVKYVCHYLPQKDQFRFLLMVRASTAVICKKRKKKDFLLKRKLLSPKTVMGVAIGGKLKIFDITSNMWKVIKVKYFFCGWYRGWKQR